MCPLCTCWLLGWVPSGVMGGGVRTYYFSGIGQETEFIIRVLEVGGTPLNSVTHC